MKMDFTYILQIQILKRKQIKIEIKKYFKQTRFTIDYKKDFMFFKKYYFFLKNIS